MAEGTNCVCPHPSLGAWGTPTPYVGPPCVLGTWGGGWSPLGSSRPLFNDFRADTTLSEGGTLAAHGDDAGSDPRGHPWVTWGVYLWAGQPPWADIILSHPPDLT